MPRIHPILRNAAVAALLLAGASTASTNRFRGVNWADPRDNFQSGVVYLSGLSSTDTYASAYAVADAVVGEFVAKLGTNGVRLPINVPTATTYWRTYTGVLDAALGRGRVLLCFWSPKLGDKPADMAAWWSMWDTVMAKYGSDPNFHVEIYNEPSGYSKADLLALYAQWLQRFPNFPRERIVLDGTGMAQNVSDVASDPRFAKCLIAVHEYTMFGSTSWTSESQWTSHFKGEVGNYADRTVATEWGGPMSKGSKNGVTYAPMDYNAAGTNFFEAYMRAVTQQIRDWKMGSFYWPGLRDNDWYSMTTRSGTGSGIRLSVSNSTGLDRLHHSWTDTAPASVGERSAVHGAVVSLEAGPSSVRMGYVLDAEAPVRISVALADGRTVADFDEGVRGAGLHAWTWDGARGHRAFLVRLRAAGTSITRMVVVP